MVLIRFNECGKNFSSSSTVMWGSFATNKLLSKKCLNCNYKF